MNPWMELLSQRSQDEHVYSPNKQGQSDDRQKENEWNAVHVHVQSKNNQVYSII